MKFTLLTLVLTALVAGLTFNAMNGWILPFALLRMLAITLFLWSLICVVYARNSRNSRNFAGGWAICSGASLMMVFAGIPIIGVYVQTSTDPHFQMVIDIAVSFVLAYFGGVLASRLGKTITVQGDG